MHNVYKVIKSGNEWHAGVDRKGFGIKQDFIPLFFFMYVQILWQGQKAILTIVEFEFFDIFYSKIQLVSTFSVYSQCCVENWLFCCDLSCKWVTCRSGCKRFWKQALHICSWSICQSCFLTLIFSCLKKFQNDLKNEAAMGLEPQINNHESSRSSYQTTRPARDELSKTRS